MLLLLALKFADMLLGMLFVFFVCRLLISMVDALCCFVDIVVFCWGDVITNVQRFYHKFILVIKSFSGPFNKMIYLMYDDQWLRLALGDKQANGQTEWRTDEMIKRPLYALNPLV